MTDETNQNEEPMREDDGGPNPATIAALMSVLGGASAVHEGGVHGSVLAQTRDLVEAYMQPETAVAESPDGVQAPIFIDKDGVHFLNASDFDDWRDRPRFRHGTATMTDLQSFIGHVDRYKDAHTVIFARDDRERPTLTAVLDYHEAGSDADPRFGKHRTHFPFPLSDEWKAWTAKDGQAMEMADFAQFLEDRIVEVVPASAVAGSFKGEDDPMKQFIDRLGGASRLADPAKLMQIASELHVLENSVAVNAVRLTSGESKVTFNTEHTTQDGQGKELTIPAAFGVAIPVFKGEQPYCVLARFRYRKAGPKVIFWYELWRTDLVFDDAFNGVVDEVQNATGLTVWKGSPESQA